MKQDYYIQSIHKKEDHTLNLHRSSSYRIIYIMNGNCLASWDKHTLLIPHESLIILPAQSFGQFKFQSSGHKINVFFASFSPALPLQLSNHSCRLSTCFETLDDICFTRPGSDITVVMISLLKRLSTLQHDKKFGWEIYRDSCLGLLLVLVNRSVLEASSQQVFTHLHLPINEVLHYILEHLHEELSLDTIASHFYVNKFYLCKHFKETTHTTIHKYIIKQRLDRCKEMLEKGLAVKDIYHQCGYQDYNHLFRSFKREFGMTPMEYVKSQK